VNFLAHTYLSGCNEEIIVGNFMGDYVKGRGYVLFPEDVKKGILIHRDIDTFTDMHMITRRSKQLVATRYSKYAGIIIDIFYDHFLASLWDDYSTLPLSEFVNRTYDLLKRNYQVLPEAIKRWFPTFLENNWMMAYTTVDGIELVLERMSAGPGKIRIVGITEVHGEKVFALEFLQGRNPAWVGKPFFVALSGLPGFRKAWDA